MKHFIYVYSEHTPRGGHTVKTAAIYQIKRNKPVFLSRAQGTFVGEFQLVWEALERLKALPRAAFARHASSNSPVYGNAWSMRDAGFADIQRVC